MNDISWVVPPRPVVSHTIGALFSGIMDMARRQMVPRDQMDAAAADFASAANDDARHQVCDRLRDQVERHRYREQCNNKARMLLRPSPWLDLIVRIEREGCALRLSDSGAIECVGPVPSHDLVMCLNADEVTEGMRAYLAERQRVHVLVASPASSNQ